MRLSLSIVFAIIAIATAQSQKFHHETLFGVNGGATISKIDFIPTVSQSSLMGLNGGITVQYISETNVGLQVELNLSQRGWKESMNDPTQSYSRRLTYIELPFLTHIYFGQQNFRYFVNLGPKIAYLLNEQESGNYSGSTNAEIGLKTNHPIDYGICGGTGFELRTKLGIFVIEGRYSFGLSDIFYNSKIDPFSRSSNQDFAVNLSYLVKL